MLSFSKLKVTITFAVLLLSILIVIVTNFSNNKFFKGIKLGLDLKGGSYLVLEPNLEILKNDYIQKLTEATNKILSANSIAYSGFYKNSNKISFNITNKNGFEKLKKDLLSYNKYLQITINENNVKVLVPEQAYSVKVSDILNQSIEIIRRRVDQFGTNEPVIKIMGSSIVVELPGVNNPNQIKNVLGKTARISFNMVDIPSTFNGSTLPLGYRYIYNSESSFRYAVAMEDILNGEHLKKASLSFNQQNQPVVSFEFDSYGAKKFGKVTSENIGKIMAIVLDNKVISAPVINSAILGGSGIIEGKFTLPEAQDLALLLQAGSLPVPLSITEENTVGPTLGEESIKSGMYSALFGLLLVLVYMSVFYRKLGFLADISLACNLVLTLALLSMFQATLTLPGIAGIILSIGMAVDSNILVYERYNYEIKFARPAIAMTNSFNRVYQTLIDSNLTTLFASLFLFYFGGGPIRGFAVTLIIGILSSMFSIFFTTRMLVNWLYLRKLKNN